MNGTALQAWMVKHDISMRRLSKLTGLSVSAVNSAKQGSVVNETTLIAIHKVTNIPYDTLIRG